MGAKDIVMATDQNPDGTSLEGQHQEPTKVTFSSEQQDKIQQLIDTAVGRTRANTSKESTDKIAALTAEIETLKTQSTGKGKESNDADKEQFKALVETAKQETERYKQEAQQREREVQTARAEAQEIRKEIAITSAASKIPFFNVDVVKTLTKTASYSTQNVVSSWLRVPMARRAMTRRWKSLSVWMLISRSLRHRTNTLSVQIWHLEPALAKLPARISRVTDATPWRTSLAPSLPQSRRHNS